jgi:hypothetical protein
MDPFQSSFIAIIRAQSRIISGVTKANVQQKQCNAGFDSRPFTTCGYSGDVTLKDWIVNEIIELFPVGGK